jgi:hypothetical protein
MNIRAILKHFRIFSHPCIRKLHRMPIPHPLYWMKAGVQKFQIRVFGVRPLCRVSKRLQGLHLIRILLASTTATELFRPFRALLVGAPVPRAAALGCSVSPLRGFPLFACPLAEAFCFTAVRMCLRGIDPERAEQISPGRSPGKLFRYPRSPVGAKQIGQPSLIHRDAYKVQSRVPHSIKPVYLAHHISASRSRMTTELRNVTALLRPSSTAIRLSSCSMERTSSYPTIWSVETNSVHHSAPWP